MDESRKHPTLSEREQQLITLATLGLTDSAIAIRLGISEPTVKSYWGRVRSKLGPYNRTELVAFALKEEAKLAVAELMKEIERLQALLLAEKERVIEIHEEMLDNAPDAVFAIDAEGNILWMNLEASRMFEYSYAELVGTHVNRLVPLELEAIHRQHMAEYVADPARKMMGEDLGTVGLRKSGEIFSIAATLAAVETQGRSIVSVFIREVPLSLALDRFVDRYGVPEMKTL